MAENRLPKRPGLQEGLTIQPKNLFKKNLVTMVESDGEVIKVVGTPFAPLTRAWCRHEAECLSTLTDMGFTNAPKLINLDGNTFTMEMIEGPSLRGHQPVDEELFLRIQGVVSQLHDLGFAHGNLRPNNILIAHDNEPFLIDFETCCLRSNPLFLIAKLSDHVRMHSLWQSRVVKSDQGRAKATFPQFVRAVMFVLTPLNRVVTVVKSIKRKLKRSHEVPAERIDTLPGRQGGTLVPGQVFGTPEKPGGR